jgi:uridine phosphorylase
MDILGPNFVNSILSMKSESELILNTKGNVYHLDLAPEMVAPICITVGDPDRVAQVSKYFDTVEHRITHREFITHSGSLQGSPIMVISTGISTDNIDIVFNELDALVNIDLISKEVKENFKQISFIRIGTSGAFDPFIPIDSLLVNRFAFGLDSLMRFYPDVVKYPDPAWLTSLTVNYRRLFQEAYYGAADQDLFQILGEGLRAGIAITCPGFYGPQGRKLRLDTIYTNGVMEGLSGLNYEGYQFTNFEMETAGIYGLANALGHKAISVNIILGNRITGEFSKNPEQAVEAGIKEILQRIVRIIRNK